MYTCLTDMVEEGGGTVQDSAGNEKQQLAVRFRKLQPDEDSAIATCNLVVMECCDQGSLRQAMKRGVFHKRMANGSVAVDLIPIVQVMGPCALLD